MYLIVNVFYSDLRHKNINLFIAQKYVIKSAKGSCHGITINSGHDEYVNK